MSFKHCGKHHEQYTEDGECKYCAAEETSEITLGVNERVDRLTDYVNLQLGVSEDVPLVIRLRELTERIVKLEEPKNADPKS